MTSTPPPGAPPAIHLLGGPYVVVGGTRMAVPEGSHRVVAYLALHRGRTSRSAVARLLWPDVDRKRAAGNLRSVMWRLHCGGLDLIEADEQTMALHPEITVDLDEVSGWADRLVSGRLDASPSAVRLTDDCPTMGLVREALDLLPGWCDEWILLERERLRERVLGGIDAVARLLIRARRYAEALDVALLAVSVDPLRDSSQAVLLQAHLAEGNCGEGARCYARYEETLERELGVRPSDDMVRLGSRFRRQPTSAAPATRVRPRPASRLALI